MVMEIKEYTKYNENDILSLYLSVGWTAYTEHPDVLRNGFANSLRRWRLTMAISFLASSELLAMAIPSCLCRISWYSQSISERASDLLS